MKTVLQKLVVLLVLLPITAMAQWTQVGETINGQYDSSSSPFPTIFGETVALSADGTVIAIGAPTNNNGLDAMAYVQIFRLVSGQWVQIGSNIEGTPYVSGLTRSYTGKSIELSADGTILAIGEPGFQEMDGENVISGGRVRVFQNINEEWVQIGDDIFESDNQYFGEYISLSAGGNVLAIHATLASPDDELFSGLVKTFQNVSGNWIQMGDTISGENYFGGKGSFLEMNAAGTKLVMAEFDLFMGQLEIETYEFNNSQWEQASSLLFSTFAVDIALSADGTKLALGLPDDEAGPNGSGIARIYNWVNDNWEEEAMLAPQIPVTNGQFGYTVSISADGNVVAVGSHLQAAYVFENTESGWEQVGEYFDILENIAPALSANGSIFAIGLPRTNDFYGSVRVYKNCMLSGESAVEPQAEAIQGFSDGDVLADLTVTADGSLTWYADEALTTVLEDTTLLVDETTYYVNQTLNGCISEAIAITVDSTLSISNYESDSFIYYPNPVKNSITFKAGSTIQSVQIYDLTGKLVIDQAFNSQELYQIDVTALPQAIYMVKVRTANNVKIIKMVKE